MSLPIQPATFAWRRHDWSARESVGPVRLTLGRLARQPAVWLGLLLVGVMLLGALLAPALAPYPPNEVDLAAQLLPPSRTHLLGTDFFGRDLLSRLMYGGRTTLGVAVLAVGLATLLGTGAGLLAGYTKGWRGQFWVAGIDLLLAFPALILALLVVAVLGPGLGVAGVAVGIAGAAALARVVRGVTLSARAQMYVEAARAAGATPNYIMRQHLLPDVLAPVLALATLDTGRAILTVAALGFLGLGAAPPQAEWGLMLYEGRQHLATAPWVSLFPGLAIMLTVLGVMLLGDALGDALRPAQHPT